VIVKLLSSYPAAGDEEKFADEVFAAVTTLNNAKTKLLTAIIEALDGLHS
jgi:hypothetical protein